MDKRSILGLIIIAAILFVFSYFNAKSVAENDTASVNKPAKVEEASQEIVRNDAAVIKSNSNLVPVLDNATGEQIYDSIQKGFLFKDTITNQDTLIKVTDSTIEEIRASEPVASITPESYTLENDKISISVTNQGGHINVAKLKEYKTYRAYMAEEEEYLQLFDENSNYGIDFYDGKGKMNSSDFAFNLVDQTDSTLTLEMANPSGKIVGYKYTLGANTYDVDFSIYFKGFSDAEADDLAFNANMKLLSTEKDLPSEQRISTVFFKYKDDSYDYLSIGGDDEEVLEETLEWFAFKQAYFSALLINESTGFKPTNDSKLEVLSLEETDTAYIKKYKANLNLGITNIANTIDLKWYFGPNDYEILALHNNGSEDIVDLGWGLFRWINVYLLMPVFSFFMNLGLGGGIAIFLLTLIVKLALSPVNYKMYKSSAMMKVLKPEIDKLAKKFPKKDDAMKKQQATMALYRETGVSPMAGCIPMLIQMPILFAIFRLFPAEIILRQKNFLWAEDLSTYDSILDFGFNIPLYGAHVSLFTLLMAATTLVYTHYNSSNMQQPTMEGLPNMKYIMYFMPIMMIFFFNSYASGLSYYYFISTLFTIGIMFAIKAFMLDEDKILAKIQANRESPKKKGKSKFAQRLEEAQKMQQERAKSKK
ncbi:membrane protein insertase YidC [Crocinitomix catalasitica]|uniref:membrane protein insertase YidC n=1 Tax=Crocinitomix catalasitica TaxID=184607 RepID=UPI00048168A1|nr:membrane protein insertase YidC [Crocinitomix catalasitica]